MKWFKHDSDSHMDAKIQKVLMKYGADGYALYWFCLELIASKIDKDNITFELEHDAEIIGFQLKVDQTRVQEIMDYMVNLNLFQSSGGMITCKKMAKRLDDTTSRNPAIKQIINKIMKMEIPEESSEIPEESSEIPEESSEIPEESSEIPEESSEIPEESSEIPGNLRKSPEQIRLDQIRLDQIRLDQIRLEKIRSENQTINKIVDKSSKTKKEKPITKRFIKPNFEQVRDYCMERKNNIDAQQFIDSNESKGWLIGKNKTPMKCWKSAINTWERFDKENQNTKPLTKLERAKEVLNAQYKIDTALSDVSLEEKNERI